MMKQLLFLITITIIVSFQGTAQEKLPKLKLGGFTGFAFYSFENLKNVNENLIMQLPFNVAVVDNFPSQLFFGGHVFVKVANWYSVGPAYQFHSTGSRMGARDYSGTYHFDQIFSTHQLGIENEIRIANGKILDFFLCISGGVNFSTWKMKEYLEATDVLQNDLNEYVATKPYINPSFKMRSPVYHNFALFVNAGYLFDLGGKYHLSGNRDYYSTQKLPWDGFRVSLGLEYEVK